MNFNLKKPALGLLAAVLLAVGAAMPASALSLPEVKWPFQPVRVESVELGEYQTSMVVGTTQQLRPYVLPENASRPQITLVSEDNTVITVMENGVIGALSEGTARVAATADGVTSYYTITVTPDPSTIVTDMDITLSKSEIAVGEEASLSISVSPSTAVQTAEVSFSSSNEKVATVSSSGVITAVASGSTAIVVSNGSSSSLVTVIVNRNAASSQEGSSGSEPQPEDPGAQTDPLYQQIAESEENRVVLPQSQLPQINSELLGLLRRTGKVLVVEGEGYTLTLDGSQIQNTGNTVDTALTFEQGEKGLEFTLNGGQSLPGVVEIALEGEQAGYTRLYLMNDSTGQWQYLNSYADSVLRTDEAGRYLLTNETLTFISVSWYALGGALVVLLAIVVVYIMVKKRYWFW